MENNNKLQFCPKCGSPLIAGKNFCSQCGTSAKNMLIIGQNFINWALMEALEIVC